MQCDLIMLHALQTSEAERIGVNQVAKVHATGNPTGTDQCKPKHVELL